MFFWYSFNKLINQGLSKNQLIIKFLPNFTKDWVGPAVVDGVLEDIRVGLEVNHPKFNQRRVASVRYLGELYNYRVIESTVIFKVRENYCQRNSPHF